MISNDSTLLINRLQCVFIKSKCGKNGVLVMKLMPHLTSSVIFNTEDEQNKKSICIIPLEKKLASYCSAFGSYVGDFLFKIKMSLGLLFLLRIYNYNTVKDSPVWFRI